jgi:fatty-acyl-CoA synthase
VPQPPRLHRGDVAASKLGANALFLNTAFSGPQLADVREREDPRRSSTTRSSRRLLEEARTAAQALVAWHEPDGERAADRSTTSSSTATRST